MKLTTHAVRYRCGPRRFEPASKQELPRINFVPACVLCRHQPVPRCILRLRSRLRAPHSETDVKQEHVQTSSPLIMWLCTMEIWQETVSYRSNVQFWCLAACPQGALIQDRCSMLHPLAVAPAPSPWNARPYTSLQDCFVAGCVCACLSCAQKTEARAAQLCTSASVHPQCRSQQIHRARILISSISVGFRGVYGS